MHPTETPPENATARSALRGQLATYLGLAAVLAAMVALFASQLAPRSRGAVWSAAWYHKQQPTFADTLAAVRREIWKAQGFSISRKLPDMQKLPRRLRDGITHALCYAA